MEKYKINKKLEHIHRKHSHVYIAYCYYGGWIRLQLYHYIKVQISIRIDSDLGLKLKRKKKN